MDKPALILRMILKLIPINSTNVKRIVTGDVISITGLIVSIMPNDCKVSQSFSLNGWSVVSLTTYYDTDSSVMIVSNANKDDQDHVKKILNQNINFLNLKNTTGGIMSKKAIKQLNDSLIGDEVKDMIDKLKYLEDIKDIELKDILDTCAFNSLNYTDSTISHPLYYMWTGLWKQVEWEIKERCKEAEADLTTCVKKLDEGMIKIKSLNNEKKSIERKLCMLQTRPAVKVVNMPTKRP